MITSIGEMRHNMKNILQALKANEKVTLLYHGKERGIIVPVGSLPRISVFQHPFFGMKAGEAEESMETTMEKLRGSRY